MNKPTNKIKKQRTVKTMDFEIREFYEKLSVILDSKGVNLDSVLKELICGNEVDICDETLLVDVCGYITSGHGTYGDEDNPRIDVIVLRIEDETDDEFNTRVQIYNEYIVRENHRKDLDRKLDLERLKSLANKYGINIPDIEK
jgi:hypothetical protein